MMRSRAKNDWAPLGSAIAPQGKTAEPTITQNGALYRKRVRHSLVLSIAATMFGTAFYIVLVVGFAWLVCADIIFLK
jgi:hypothetical protein